MRGILWILLAFVLAACNSALPGDAGAKDALQPVPTSTALQAATPTPSPTATPTPLPPLALLLTPPGADPAQAQAVQAVLSELAAQAGLRFENRQALSPAEIDQAVSLVVALPPDPGLAELAKAAPNTQFLALGISGIPGAENLSSIGGVAGAPDQQGFIAGYLAAVITDDWRIGAIIPGDMPTGQVAGQGFVNGAIFYCGLCRPVYPPYVQYPQLAELPAGADQATWQAAADSLISQGVKTVYVFPGLDDTALFEYLAQAGVNLIGGVAPPDSVREHWVATIQADAPGVLKEAWSRLLTGESGLSIAAPLELTDQNPKLFSPGRQRLVDATLADLQAGFIGTGVPEVP